MPNQNLAYLSIMVQFGLLPERYLYCCLSYLSWTPAKHNGPGLNLRSTRSSQLAGSGQDEFEDFSVTLCDVYRRIDIENVRLGMYSSNFLRWFIFTRYGVIAHVRN
jgi:hypothetical protein